MTDTTVVTPRTEKNNLKNKKFKKSTDFLLRWSCNSFTSKQRLLAKCLSIVLNYLYKSLPGFSLSSDGGTTASYEKKKQTWPPYGRVSGWDLIYKRRPGGGAVGASWQEVVWWDWRGGGCYPCWLREPFLTPRCETSASSARTRLWHVGLSPSLQGGSVTSQFWTFGILRKGRS